MLTRSWIALLLLTNYLLVVGLGGMNRPEDQSGWVLVQTNVVGHSYQQCRYLRMDGLEDFLLEALASRYQNAPLTPTHHLISVINGIDAHCLPDPFYPVITADDPMAPRAFTYQRVTPAGLPPGVDAPPWLG